MNEFRRFFKIFFFLSAAYFMFCAAVVWLVDPFNELGRNKIGLYFSTDRQKINQIAKHDHDAILIGSSKVRSIDAKLIKCYSFYNAGFARAFPEEIYLYLKRYLTNEKFVAIGFDFYMFNERQFPLVPMDGWQDRQFGNLEYLTSFRALQSSFIALRKWKKGEQPELNTEERIQTGIKPMDGRPDREVDLKETDYGVVKTLVTNHYFRRPKVSLARLDYVKKTRDFLVEKGVPFVFFINPHNWEIVKILNNEEIGPGYRKWKALLKEAVPELVDLSEGKYSALRHYPLADPYHYYSETGADFLNEIIPCAR